MFAAWGRFVYRARWPMLFVSALLLAGSIAVASGGGNLTSDSIIKTSESGRGLDVLQKEIPAASGSSFTVIFSSDKLTVNDPGFGEAMIAALKDVRGDPRVDSVRTAFDTKPPSPVLVSRDQHRALATVAVKDDINVATKYYPELRRQIRSDTLSVTATGTLSITNDFQTILEEDLQRAETVSLPLALILLLIVFGTAVAAFLPLGVGILAVVGGVAGLFALSHVTEVSQYALNIVTLIGLGVAIDYSLFIVNRYREELARFGERVPGSGAPREQIALARTMATAGRAITFSGITVAIGLSGLLFFQGTFLASMGMAGAIVVALAVLYGLTFLPALLAILGARVNALRLPIGRPREPGERGFWHALATGVMKRPILVLIPVLLFIIVTASPFLRLRLANGDVNFLPKHAESRSGYETLRSEFPGYQGSGLSVILRWPGGDPLAPERVAQARDLAARIAKLPDALRVDSPFAAEGFDYRMVMDAPAAALPPQAQQLQHALKQAVGPHVMVLQVASARAANTVEAEDLVRAIRATPAPPGAEMLVTGQSALSVDVVSYILSKTPLAVLWIVLATYIVLFLLLGSVVLPLKAVIMNLLSIATSFGALVWFFQEGHFGDVLGFTGAPIDPTLPVIMFCIIFGLSMDYEVLLLSRMQEEYLKGRDNAHAVAEGLERSGRLITGAAAIMVGVFLAFGLAEVVFIKAIGLGMALAVAIDATLVRALVVPATMRLLGDLNWWAPGPLARLYDRLGMGEAASTARLALLATEAD